MLFIYKQVFIGFHRHLEYKMLTFITKIEINQSASYPVYFPNLNNYGKYEKH